MEFWRADLVGSCYYSALKSVIRTILLLLGPSCATTSAFVQSSQYPHGCYHFSIEMKSASQLCYAKEIHIHVASKCTQCTVIVSEQVFQLSTESKIATESFKISAFKIAIRWNRRFSWRRNDWNIFTLNDFREGFRRFPFHLEISEFVFSCRDIIMCSEQTRPEKRNVSTRLITNSRPSTKNTNPRVVPNSFARRIRSAVNNCIGEGVEWSATHLTRSHIANWV
jgi:hypothetical protein